MQYNYEALTPDRFQQLCQALITHSYPDTVSFPVGKKDGGRDALVAVPGGETIVFQVKFRRTREEDPGDAAKVALAAFESELENIKQLHGRGATKYILVTNLSATAGLDTGERDRVAARLIERSPIPASVWWREEVDAHLTNAYDVKWAFSEVITSADLLRKLLEEGFGESSDRRDLAITSYLTAQYAVDEFVKFKQADLQASDLLALFVDVPAKPQRSPDAKRERETRVLMQDAVAELGKSDHVIAPDFGRLERDVPVGAATLLLTPVGQRCLDSVVLEGGPGQGKSTLAQYVCQVHRMKILGKKEKLTLLPLEHRQAPVRVPFKVDLRDLANWLRRIDPFTGDRHPPGDVTPSVESFLAAQVRHLSGGQTFSVDDLRLFLRRVPALVVLDGLDEVAVTTERRDVIEAINGARARLMATAASIQILVTSRPAATASTPRPSGSDWHFVDLGSIGRDLIFDYTDRWAAARRLDALDLQELRETLEAKLSSPHITDLARNAMQLTILLQLIHSRGSALPDQRTQLYDRYVDILFNREADKNKVVRVHRQLLIDIHGFLAWRMHSAAQSMRANGRVSEDEMREMIRTYLASRGHDPAVLDDLFLGVVQRVVALVSRVQGTFEFEVQPLREYFAGRHLYNTAPSSPVGNPQSGTKLEIFAALARQPYWLNVMRFYAGCYSIGEISGLADQVEELLDDPRYGRTSFARVVACSLLGDRVFQQSPKITSKVVKKTADPLTIRYAIGQVIYGLEGPRIGLPSDCGQGEFLRVTVDRAVSHDNPAIRFESALVAESSFPYDVLLDYWLSLEPMANDPMGGLERWLVAGNAFGATQYLPNDRALRLAERGDDVRKMLAWGGSTAILGHPDVQAQLLTDALEGRREGLGMGLPGEIGWALMVLDTRSGWQSERFYWPRRPAQEEPAIVDRAMAAFVGELAEVLAGPENEQRRHWDAANLVEAGAGRCWLAWAHAIQGFDAAAQAEDLSAGAEPTFGRSSIIEAVAGARRRQASVEWWLEALSTSSDPVASRALVAMSILWCTPTVLRRTLPSLEALIKSMDSDGYGILMAYLVGMRGRSGRKRLTSRIFGDLAASIGNARALVALSARGTGDSRQAVLRSVEMADALSDRTLARMVLQDRIEQVFEDARVDDALEEVMTLFARVGTVFPRGIGDSASISEELANRVIGEPDRFPVSLIRAADAALSTEATRGPGVASIARRQAWSAG